MSQDVYEEYHLRRVINASGTLTTYGQSAIAPCAVEAMQEVSSLFFEMNVLHARASELIAKLAGAEAGFVTSCASAGITLGIAACMTGTDPAKIDQLPDTTGMKNEVILQLGHAVNYGAPVTQGVRLSGAQVKYVGTINGTSRDLLAASFGPNTVAAMYVISHHTVQFGCVPLETFVEIAHAAGVPVIVDMAAEEHMLAKVVATGADIVVCSGHKHFRAPTSGVMAGKMALMQAAYAQNRGIGRAMKIGKEGIVGLLTALDEWAKGSYRESQAAEKQRVERMVEKLAGLPGLRATIEWPDPELYPIIRTRVTIDAAAAGLTAMALTQLLADGDPTVRVRAHHAEEGYFFIDPFNLSDADANYICQRIIEIMQQPAAVKQAAVDQLAGLSMADIWTRSGEWPYFEPKA